MLRLSVCMAMIPYANIYLSPQVHTSGPTYKSRLTYLLNNIRPYVGASDDVWINENIDELTKVL